METQIQSAAPLIHLARREKRQYVDLNTVYVLDKEEKLDSPNYEISYVSLSKERVHIEEMRNFRNRWLTMGLQADFNYVRLIQKGHGIMMSDTPMERNTNEAFIRNAHGDVLIFGIGLGLIVFPLLESKAVKSITIVELDAPLINVVGKHIAKHDKRGIVKIIHGDAFEYHEKLTKADKFDSIYFDIWLSICGDNYEEQKKLHAKYRKFLNKENQYRFIDSWLFDHYKSEKRKGNI